MKVCSAGRVCPKGKAVISHPTGLNHKSSPDQTLWEPSRAVLRVVFVLYHFSPPIQEEKSWQQKNWWKKKITEGVRTCLKCLNCPRRLQTNPSLKLGILQVVEKLAGFDHQRISTGEGWIQRDFFFPERFIQEESWFLLGLCISHQWGAGEGVQNCPSVWGYFGVVMAAVFINPKPLKMSVSTPQNSQVKGSRGWPVSESNSHFQESHTWTQKCSLFTPVIPANTLQWLTSHRSEGAQWTWNWGSCSQILFFSGTKWLSGSKTPFPTAPGREGGWELLPGVSWSRGKVGKIHPCHSHPSWEAASTQTLDFLDLNNTLPTPQGAEAKKKKKSFCFKELQNKKVILRKTGLGFNCKNCTSLRAWQCLAQGFIERERQGGGGGEKGAAVSFPQLCLLKERQVEEG